MADFFISYSQSDHDFAEWIGKELEALGHKPHIHEWEIEGGKNIYAWMEARLDAAHHMLCVVSEEYLKAPYSTLERRAGLWVAAKEQPGFVLLAQVKPCRLPRLSANISRCNLVGKPHEIASKATRLPPSKWGSDDTRAASRSPRCTGCAVSARRRSPLPMPSFTAATTAPPGGSGRRASPACAPIWWRSACASAGHPRTTKRNR